MDGAVELDRRNNTKLYSKLLHVFVEEDHVVGQWQDAAALKLANLGGGLGQVNVGSEVGDGLVAAILVLSSCRCRQTACCRLSSYCCPCHNSMVGLSHYTAALELAVGDLGEDCLFIAAKCDLHLCQ
jgi:hypothetical protein